MNDESAPNPPRNGEGDHAKRGGGGSRPLPRPIVARARRLRREMTPPEVALWQYLRLRPANLKFRRQHPITIEYVADFFCVSARLVVEVDGEVHNSEAAAKRDQTRDEVISKNGVRIVRLNAADVLHNTQEAVTTIVAIAESPHHHPSDGPPARYGED